MAGAIINEASAITIIERIRARNGSTP
jgi:hypothetical protein